MPLETATDLLDALGHPRRAEIEALRRMIMRAEPALAETVKWNAPSYVFAGEDRLTMRLQPGSRMELVFHLGARKRHGGGDCARDFPLLKRLGPDRAMIGFRDMADIEAQAEALGETIRRWMRIPAT